MAYNKLNHLKRVAEMQNFVLNVQKEHRGLPLTRIYKDYVRERFFISYSTFNRWLEIPAKRELEKEKGKGV